MPDIIRTREMRYREDYSSDDDRSSNFGRAPRAVATQTRYRVRSGRGIEELDDDRRSLRADPGPRRERAEFDDRFDRYEIERPRSAVERVEFSREPLPWREPERERERERTRTVVYERERREPESARPWERVPSRPWETERDLDVAIVRREAPREERERELDVSITRRQVPREREEPVMEVERYQRETEYYSRPEPAPKPILIRQRAPEPQQIIVEAAKTPLPIVLPREEPRYERREEVDDRQVTRRDPRREEEDYYYRKDVREVGPTGRRSEHERREYRRGSFSDDDYNNEGVLVTRKTVIRSRENSPNHKRHLAEGAVAGAAAAAIIASHRKKTGSGGNHTAGKVVSGAALGAIGAELVTRARSRYRDQSGSRSRSRSSSRGSHSKLRVGLGLAAAALAAAAAGKYISGRRTQNREEATRGRARTRSRGRSYTDDESGDSYSAVSRSRSRPVLAPAEIAKKRNSTIAKAGLGAAAVAGVAEVIRNRSKAREGRSTSRVRTGTAIAATGLAGAAVGSLYANRKAKQDAADFQSRGRSLSRSRSRSRTRSPSYSPSRSRSRSRSRRRHRKHRTRSRSVVYSDPGIDDNNMVQYGANPVYTDQNTSLNEQYYPTDTRRRSRRQSTASAPRPAQGPYYPQEEQFPPRPPAGFTQHHTTSTTHVNSYQPGDNVSFDDGLDHRWDGIVVAEPGTATAPYSPTGNRSVTFGPNEINEIEARNDSRRHKRRQNND